MSQYLLIPFDLLVCFKFKLIVKEFATIKKKVIWKNVTFNRKR